MLQENKNTSSAETVEKLVIYQLFPRYFGNKCTSANFYGSIIENGCGKFDDITSKALEEIKTLGANCVWYTGIIEQATMTDYTAAGILQDDPDVVKGRAGSPYAIRDYYDVSPDLANDINNRMTEFEALLKRNREAGLKVLIDFVPNHVARTYQSDSKPEGVIDLGENDDQSQGFSATNDFYYLPETDFVVPDNYNAGGDRFTHELKDGKFNEHPAKVTGNNVFSATPSIADWFETIKLNYGVDVLDNHAQHFVPHPPLWKKMRDILIFWAAKGVDGFRCDMVEMVPVEFWSWVIADLKKRFPALIFIGEAYDRSQYKNFIVNGKFDFLYDKVGIYDSIKRLIRNEYDAHVNEISLAREETSNFAHQMLRFLENHDEVRIAADTFAGNPWYAIPGMVISATLSTGPVMIYNGQEVGEPAIGAQGFSGNDGRSTIFDYWMIPRHQKWMNDGAFDGGQLNEEESNLREFYCRLLNVSRSNDAIVKGDFYELLSENQFSRGFNGKVYAYIRYTKTCRVLILTNFNRELTHLQVMLPIEMLRIFGLENSSIHFTDLLSGVGFSARDSHEGLILDLPATSGVVLEF
jgi:glycosidase